jgi:nucleoid DNA-binding protein
MGLLSLVIFRPTHHNMLGSEVGLKNITKQDLIQEAAKSSGHSQLEVREVTEQFMRVVGEYLVQDATIEIRGFGTFYAKERKPRPARNPRTGEVCPLGRRRVALFRFSADMKDRIREVPELVEVMERAQAQAQGVAVGAKTGAQSRHELGAESGESLDLFGEDFGYSNQSR